MTTDVTLLPTLIVISGPSGSGKTTLAHTVARAVGCPAICRDEIKEGMVHAARAGTAPDFVPAPGDELTVRTLPAFFDVLELLLRSGVTTVAEAAYQDQVWRQRLEPLLDLARLRIVHCRVDADLAFRRTLRRARQDPVRRAHADPDPQRPPDQAQHRVSYRAFRRISLAAPALEVDTTDGYEPGLDQIVSFVNGRA
jgi:predicted kinase